MDTQNGNCDPQSNDLDILKKMEDEHLRLQRQVREIQADRQAGMVGVHPQFRRQDELMRTLKKEYINFCKDLKIANSGAHKKKDRKMRVDLKKSLILRKQSELEAEEGVTIMTQLDGVLQRNNKQMLDLKKVVADNMGQINQRRALSERRLVQAENKLEIATRRFNMVQCENKKIREEIEHMLKDRIIFNHAWEKMLAVLNKGKKFLQDLFESSTLAYDQRDEWCAKLKSMQEKGKIDQSMQLQEMRELQKTFDHEMKLYNFLARKGIRRVNTREEKMQELLKRREEDDTRKAIEVHQKILEDVTNYTQQDYVQTIKTFRKMEQQIFSIYKILTDCCAENEILGRDLKRIRQDVDDRRDWNEGQEQRRQEKLQQLQQIFEQKKMVSDELRGKVNEKDHLINSTMEKIGGIFKMLDCSVSPFQNLLGDKGPSTWQLHLTLTQITQKINEYIQVVYYNERIAKKPCGASGTSRLKKYTVYAEPPRFFTALPINLMVPADPCPACVEARWFSRVSDLPEVPFTRAMAVKAIEELNADPSYVRSDRVHPLTDCRVPKSREILAIRYNH